MLEIRNLTAGVESKPILRGLNLTIYAGETHVVMGQNGSGKSTLSYVLAGKPDYVVMEGQIWFKGKNLLEMSPEARAGEGLFLAFQYPIEIPGLSMGTFLKTAVNEVRAYRGLPSLDARTFLALQREKLAELGLSSDIMGRSVNEGFSGGEKKKNEILQMAMLDPDLAILDETDSGLDLDAIKQVTAGILKMKNSQRAFLIITHYPQIVEYLQPDKVHIMINGRIEYSGGIELAALLEKEGYEYFKLQSYQN
ncbi:MAG: Fe-S cluster assembly ATPase SufC [Flavobacteriales bacterium]|nr:Fe-S cluster assembly ATPase SufC [Flavobacteriales bacterium]